ncbi:hypothetical protein MSMAW_1808 [Methanosarcina mazei WWM610]|uniref:Uncharacterized protein n=5 Tax=Methanosarcina mazei TaxID=2209 RepID=M1Q0R5_METMZ|nr:hypothetical protein MmTuc01_2891 [Methanosarcina mazei Tuc01]AKB40799.1 hypothetical protein MSMAW_1808 [Methanosarcina mazei WWM610]AKB65094.1 hypothetical protein MSMAS_1898 [Methanosarcina mazei S-6]AKB68465.1 hypothetical protein MSMAL_1922 [Methanosarcina mazei LYC]AKB71117.1 hypothetical protein MSMAC_1227 [Methanosarcina mazei C16]UWJ23332.1 hypothetical protein MSMAT_2075 [Methanosarcina mazei TMA]
MKNHFLSLPYSHFCSSFGLLIRFICVPVFLPASLHSMLALHVNPALLEFRLGSKTSFSLLSSDFFCEV